MSRTDEDIPGVSNPRRVQLDPQTWILGALLLLLFGGSFLYAYRQGHFTRPEMVITAADTASTPSAPSPTNAAAPSPEEIVVHVTGAVKSPGVYRLPRGSRVDDAVRAAGGFAETADQIGINLAARVEDGDQVIVPSAQVPEASADIPSGTTPATSGTRTPPPTESPRGGGKLRDPREGTINVNTASAEELQRLPGVGPAIAARIIAYRKEIGRFTSVDQLLEVSGIGEKKLAAMRPFVRVR